MRLYILLILATLDFILAGYHSKKTERVYATCYGYAPCNACKNCSACKHCNSGGTCGICAPIKKSSPSKTPTKQPVTKQPVTRQPLSLQCKAKTQKGTRCSRSVKSGSYCWQHS